MKIVIAWLYPNLMSIYGDYGNVLTLTRRISWRGIKVEVIEINFENTNELSKADIILMGGGQDRQQAIVVKDMLDNKKKYLQEAHQKGIPALFACGGYQIMGHFYHPLKKDEFVNFDPTAFEKKLFSYKFIPGEGADIPGLKIFPQYTIHYGNELPRPKGRSISSSEQACLRRQVRSLGFIHPAKGGVIFTKMNKKHRCIGNIVTKINPNLQGEIQRIYTRINPICKKKNCQFGLYPTTFLQSQRSWVYKPVTSNQLPVTSLVGFENHGGRTYFMKTIEHKNIKTKNNLTIQQFSNAAFPLGKVIKGYGNNGEDGTEGIIINNFIGTYLHGFLIKNPHIADFLIAKALELKYGKVKLEPLDDTLEWQTHERFRNKILRNR